MERKMTNLGRAKKKLRYFQSDESTPCHLKIKDVFSMKDLDNIFDDLDSAPGTPLLSPLPKSPGLEEQNKRSHSKPFTPFRREISPLKGSDDLVAEADIQVDHLNDKGSPLEEIAPIKTSSPIELLAVEHIADDAEKPETSPLLFGIEDEEPVDFRKPLMNQRSESPKDFPYRDKELLESPPAQLKFGKPTEQNDPVTSTTPQKAPEAPDQVCKTSATEPESQTDRHTSLSTIVLIQKHQPEPLPERQPNKQTQEVAVEVGLKQSLFQKKLRNSLQPKASAFRKQETVKQPARAPSPHVQEEDFVILEDDSPIRFTIPRKAEIKEKPAPENRSVEPHAKGKASSKETKEAEKLEDGPKKKRRAECGRSSDFSTKDLMVQSEREDNVHNDVGGGEEICLSPDTNQDAEIPGATPVVTGKKLPKGKSSKTEQQCSKDGNDVCAKSPAEKPKAKTKKSAKLVANTNTEEEEPVSSVKTKPTKIKSAIRAGVYESTGLISAKPKKPDEGKSVIKNKKRVKGRNPEVQDETESTPDPVVQPEVQGTSTVYIPAKKAKELSCKQAAIKKPRNVKKTEKTNEIKELVFEPDVSAEASVSSKRKRKPPGEWWLTQHEENITQEQQEEVQSSVHVKSRRKAQKKAPVFTDSPEQELSTTSQEVQNKPVAVQKLPKKVAKSQSISAGSRKSPKSAGGRRKAKSGAQERREMRQALPVEEEASDHEGSGQLSPVLCSTLPRQRSVTPGDKRVFDKIYTREGQSGSAQKCSQMLLDEVKSVPVKRQRTSPQNWWEVPQSQEPAESSLSPRISSSRTSRPEMGPPRRNPGPSTERGRGARHKGRRNLLHSLEDQSEQSSENVHNDCQQQASSHATFDVCVSGVVSESSADWRKSYPQASSGSNRASDYDIAFKSGPSSLIELERYEELEDAELPSSRIIPQTRFTPRVLSECDLCGPPLKPIVLDNEDWDNLGIWLTHIWPNTSKDSKGISPDDFHWHSHAGRAMGHMVDLQSNTFSTGKILLGSYMKKPAQIDHDAVIVFHVASSCVKVEIDGVKEIHNSGQTFMTACGQSYSIHNMCQEPAVLWYNRMFPNHTVN
ncbi:titin isoform X2 [Tachysurus fulvidraco]|uniref:titin isoform X2 n=1 Tax=Tachysurus fulvidraco TaxID=1234273 RepID=UPI001FEE7E0D|nr:titin isoform X2 [Tachysurus fulvidraco]